MRKNEPLKVNKAGYYERLKSLTFSYFHENSVLSLLLFFPEFFYSNILVCHAEMTVITVAAQMVYERSLSVYQTLLFDD